MILLLLLLLVVIAGAIYYYNSNVVAAGIIQNKTKLTGEHVTVSSKDFDSFLNRKINSRLVYIAGADKSGKMHLANMLAKKYGYKVVDGKGQKTQAVRATIRIADTPREATEKERVKDKARIESEKDKRKYIVVGKYSDEELEKIFIGKGYNRNFVFLYVMPQPGCETAFGKVMDLHGDDKKDNYKSVLAESQSLLKSHKLYRLYIVKNCYK